MKKIFICLLSLILIYGCSNNIEKHYYKIDFKASEDKIISTKNNLYVHLLPIQLVDELDQPGILFQIDQYKFINTQQNLWLSPLPGQLTTYINNYLAYNHIQNVDNIKYKPTINIKLELTKFNSHYQGFAMVEGKWIIQKGKAQKNIPFFMQIPLKDTGYPALINALTIGLDKALINLVKNLN